MGDNTFVYDIEFPGGEVEKVVPRELVKALNPPGFWYYQAPCSRWYLAPRMQIMIAFLIMLNFCVNVAESEHNESMTKGLQDGYDFSEWVFTILFTVELCINMYGHWFAEFWASWWNWFDFIIIGISLLVLVAEDLPGFTVLRLLRAFRVFRLFNKVKALAQIVHATEAAIPGVAGAFFILLLVIAIYAILGVQFFPDVELSEGLATDTRRFGTFNKAFFPLFQVMTGDSWHTISIPCMELYGFTAELYFLTFILTTSFLLVNIAIAILLENMTTVAEQDRLDHAGVYYAEVVIRGAVNIPAMDLDGSVDPYCEVRFVYAEEVGKGARPPDLVQYTSPLKNTFAPVWEETFLCPGKPQWVEIYMCDKDFGLAGYVGSRMSKLTRKMGLNKKVNKQGDDIIGVQRRNFVRMFERLAVDDELATTKPEQHALPLLTQFPKRNSKQDPKDDYVYGDDSKKDVATIMFVVRAGRNASSNKDTVTILKELKRSEDRLGKRLSTIEQKVAMLEGDTPLVDVSQGRSLSGIQVRKELLKPRSSLAVKLAEASKLAASPRQKQFIDG